MRESLRDVEAMSTVALLDLMRAPLTTANAVVSRRSCGRWTSFPSSRGGSCPAASATRQRAAGRARFGPNDERHLRVIRPQERP